MSEPSTEQVERAQAALRAINDAVQEYLNAIADEGEPEVLQECVVLLLSQGMNDRGLFERNGFCIPEYSGSMARMLGMLDLAYDKAQHHFRCPGGHEE